MQLTIAGGIATAIAFIIVGALIMRRKMGGRSIPPGLKPGQPLPAFNAVDEDGKEQHSADLRGRPTVILFVRGSWCPFCSRQVANLTKHYKDINELGARLILITPKPLQTTRRVAKLFEVDFEFWLDDDLAIAKQLGLILSHGVPADYQKEYGKDTYWPASIVVDGNGIIRHTWLSKFIMDRPDPAKLFDAVKSL
jgi:peroxiredoxin